MWTKEKGRQWIENNREHIRAYDRQHYKNLTEEKKTIVLDRAKRYYQKHREAKIKRQKLYYQNLMATEPEKVKRYYYNRNERNLESIAGRPRPSICEICGSGVKICFDHSHATGKFRGWICQSCNMVLGHARDRIEILEKLIVYLKKDEAKPASPDLNNVPITNRGIPSPIQI